jgi:hypothetical protein
MLSGASGCYWTVREKVVVWTIEPEVAVTVTMEVPVATGFGFGVVDAPLDPPQPASVKVRTNSVREPP